MDLLPGISLAIELEISTGELLELRGVNTKIGEGGGLSCHTFVSGIRILKLPFEPPVFLHGMQWQTGDSEDLAYAQK